MISSTELRCVAAFSDLPEEQLVWFLSAVEDVSLQAGEVFARQGDPADWMIVFLEGLFQWRGEFGGDTVSLPAHAGEVSGIFPFSRMKRFTVTGRALTDGRLLKFPAALFPELIQKMPELTTRLVAIMSDRIREGTRIEQQRDRLVSLGKLAAGLAHELNNPASAAQRASGGMRHALAKMRNANAELWRRPIQESERARIETLEASLLQSSTPLEGLALSDLEEHLRFNPEESWLREFMGAFWRSCKSEHACRHTDFSAERHRCRNGPCGDCPHRSDGRLIGPSQRDREWNCADIGPDPDG